MICQESNLLKQLLWWLRDLPLGQIPSFQWNVWLQAWNPTLPLPKTKGFFVYPRKGQKARMTVAIGCGVTIQYWKVEKSRQIIIRKDIILFISFCQSYLATLLYYTFFAWNVLDLSFNIINTCLVLCKYTFLKSHLQWHDGGLLIRTFCSSVTQIRTLKMKCMCDCKVGIGYKVSGANCSNHKHKSLEVHSSEIR